MNRQYKLRYLPLFEHDLRSAYDYIALELLNPDAAHRLAVETEQAIRKRLSAPTAFKPYKSKRDRAHRYYTIKVRNYTVYYVIIDDVMEIRRFLYSRRDATMLI